MSSQPQQKSYPPNAFKREKLTLSTPFIKFQQDQISGNMHQKNMHQKNISQVPISQQQKQSESQAQQLQKQAQDIVNQLTKIQQAKKANDKVVVGTGFSFDITEFFKFQKKKELKDGDIFGELSGSVFAWLILLYSVMNSSIIPGWIMNIKATKLLRISWRFLLQSLIVIPFVLYEYRISSQQVKNQYKLSHILKPVHLKKVYLSSISTSIWFTCILTAFEWSFVSHGLVLGALSNFFLSLHRSVTKSNHQVESGGQTLVVIGILLIIYDSIIFQPSQATQQMWNVVNPFYLTREWYQRVGADLFALGVSFTQCRISRYTADMKSHYPPNLSIFLVNMFVCLNMIFSTYFFNGLTFDYDLRYGLFSIFSQQHFASFFYMSILLNTGLFISFVMISKLFPDPIFPAMAMTLDPILATFFVQVFGVQMMPTPMSFIGYLFVLPGLIVILLGQCLYQRKKQKDQKDQEDNKRSAQILKQMKQIKKSAGLAKTDKKNKLRRVQTIRNEIDQRERIKSISRASSTIKEQQQVRPRKVSYQNISSDQVIQDGIEMQILRRSLTK